ncbi:MAG: divalent metal cation transporter [Bacteroidota bacterium]|nr:MAG: divalent metal cation transporter [Bacteroidota bacterium]
MKLPSIKALGPGLIWAGASIGVSHLVQSTRAGADFGFQLVWVVVLANLLKYPFFEFGPRYASSTGETLVQAYYRQGKATLWLYFGLTLATMFSIQAGVTSVTAGLMGNLFPGLFSQVVWTLLLLSICLIVILIGKYKTLDNLMKIIVLVLTLTTLVAFAAALGKGYHPNPEHLVSFDWNFTQVAFLLALAGWMPSAVDVSVWHSVWTVAKIKQTGYHPSLKEALFDFNLGYIGTAVMAIFFLSLGALVMYGSGEVLSANGVEFSGQLIQLYTLNIGNWAYYIIAIAALATMFSTTLTVLDAYPRVMCPATSLLIPKLSGPRQMNYVKLIWFFLLIALSLLLIFVFSNKMRALIDLATTLSFITAPVLGYLNLKAVTGKNMPEKNKPGIFLHLLSWIGMIALSGFAVYFLIFKFFL